MTQRRKGIIMKAIRVNEFGDPGVMRLEEVADPEPGPGQVVIRVRAAGVNPVDTYIRGGLHGYQMELPLTPGFDASGTVESVGKGVTGWKKGDRVYCAGTVTGAYAEKALCEADQLHPLPPNVTFPQGGCVHVPYATAYRALYQRAYTQPGETVLVHGASGSVGIAAVQLARASGQTVIGTAGTEESRTLVLKEGAHNVIDHHDPDHFERILELTGGTGVDVILEMLANVNLGRDLPVLARGGRVVVIGSRGTVEIDARDTMSRDASILGMSLRIAPPGLLGRIHTFIVAGLENQTLRPIVGKELPLSQAAAAHHQVMETRAFGNIVLIP